jgi:transcriptional regulator with XRE-family HTH domain
MFHTHAGSVSAITAQRQAGLLRVAYADFMPFMQDSAPHERIAYAIQQCGKTLEQLAATVGCSHAALSQWQTGATKVANIKAGLLHSFAEATGVDIRWVLSGVGPAISRYILRDEMERIAVALYAMERSRPQQVETVIRMVEAAAGDN